MLMMMLLVALAALSQTFPPRDDCADPDQRGLFAPDPAGQDPVRICDLKGVDAAYLSRAVSLLGDYDRVFDLTAYHIEAVQWSGVYQVVFFLGDDAEMDCDIHLGYVAQAIFEFNLEESAAFVLSEEFTKYDVGLLVTIAEENNHRGQSPYACPIHHDVSATPFSADGVEAQRPE